MKLCYLVLQMWVWIQSSNLNCNFAIVLLLISKGFFFGYRSESIAIYLGILNFCIQQIEFIEAKILKPLKTGFISQFLSCSRLTEVHSLLPQAPVCCCSNYVQRIYKWTQLAWSLDESKTEVKDRDLMKAITYVWYWRLTKVDSWLMLELFMVALYCIDFGLRDTVCRLAHKLLTNLPWCHNILLSCWIVFKCLCFLALLSLLSLLHDFPW